MRESLRGALLSVLFFALILGGAPSMVAATETDCTLAGDCSSTNTKPHRSGKTQAERHQEFCDSMKGIETVGIGMGTVGVVTAFMGFGGILAAAGGMTAGIGHIAGRIGGC